MILPEITEKERFLGLVHDYSLTVTKLDDTSISLPQFTTWKREILNTIYIAVTTAAEKLLFEEHYATHNVGKGKKKEKNLTICTILRRRNNQFFRLKQALFPGLIQKKQLNHEYVEKVTDDEEDEMEEEEEMMDEKEANPLTPLSRKRTSTLVTSVFTTQETEAETPLSKKTSTRCTSGRALSYSFSVKEKRKSSKIPKSSSARITIPKSSSPPPASLIALGAEKSVDKAEQLLEAGYTIVKSSVYFQERIDTIYGELETLAASSKNAKYNTLDKILEHYIGTNLSSSLQDDSLRKMQDINSFPTCNTTIACGAFFAKMREFCSFVQEFMKEGLALGTGTLGVEDTEHILAAAVLLASFKKAKPQHWHMDGQSSEKVILFAIAKRAFSM